MGIGSGSGFVTSGFSNGVYVNVATAQPTLGAGDGVAVSQGIEGYRVSRLAWGTASANPITIAFWSKHHRIGVYSVWINNAANNRSYATAYTHAVADVAQYNVLTIPGDTTGAWEVTNLAGMRVGFSFGSGTTYTAPSANTWLAGIYQAAPGQVNAVATTSDISIITGVIVLPGIYAPTAAQSPLIMRPYDQELVTCQRYYEKLLGPITGTHPGASYSCDNWTYKVMKRAAPSVVYGAGSIADGYTTLAIDNFNAYKSAAQAYLNIGTYADARL